MREENAKQLAYLRKALQAAGRAGDRESERDYAKKILALDPGDAEAGAVRNQARDAAAKDAEIKIPGGDPKAVEAVWAAYANAWPGDAEAGRLQDQHVEKAKSEARGRVLSRKIPAGTFLMGCAAGDGECSEPAHEVRITKAFYMAETETTNAQYQRCVEAVSPLTRNRRNLNSRRGEEVLGVIWGVRGE